jgi:hypothetical protein
LGEDYECEPRGLIDVKGLGKIPTSFLIGRRGGAPLHGIGEADDARSAADQ